MAKYRWLIAGVISSILIFLGCGIYYAFKIQGINNSIPDVLNKQVEEAHKIRVLEGLRTKDSTRQVDGKIIFVNFWEAWCKPCIEEMPSIQQLYRSKADSSTRFFIISRESMSDSVRKKFLEKYDLPFYHLKDTVPALFNGPLVPRSYIIHNNVVVWQETGSRDWSAPDVQQFMDSLKKVN